jgi:hypothetical protein
MQVFKKTAIVALLLLPAFFLLHNYNELFGFIKINQLFLYGAIIYIPVLLCLLILLVTKKWNTKSSLIFFSILVLVLLFGPINNYARHLIHTGIFGSRYTILLICLIILVLIVKKIIRSKQIAPRTVLFVNLAVACLVSTELIMLVVNAAELEKTNNLIYYNKRLSDQFVSPNLPDSAKPDIYFFVFDEYTNNQTLEKLWHYHNDSITNFLMANGFHLPAQPHANYSFTIYSVSSTFNMDYIDPEKGSDGTIPRYVLQANESLSDNETFSILKKEQYDIHFLAPFDNKIESTPTHFFDYISNKQIQAQTLPGTFAQSDLWTNLAAKIFNGDDKSVAYAKSLKEKYQNIRSTVEKIKSTTDSSTNRKPHFVYGHIMVPHEPHMFNKDGGFMTYEEYLKSTAFDTYTPQITYGNSLMKEIVSYIKQHNRHNTIIVIEGDHGFRGFVEDGMDWFNRTPDSLKRYFLPNFNAVYFPDNDYSRIYDQISPINTFRVIFDQFFHQHFPMLKDTGTVVKDTIY